MADIEEDQTVVFYPSYGRLIDGGRRWRITVTGAVFESPEVKLRDRVALRVLQKVMRVQPEALQSDVFQQRIARFLSQTERRRRIAVQVGSRVHVLKKKSKRYGFFRGAFSLNHDEVEQLERDGHIKDGWLDFAAATGSGSDCQFAGRAQLIGDSGVSIVSDIDDTIKHTDVTSRRAMLVNTFLRRFEPVEGMSNVFRDWAESGAAIHFVSSSPWQLYHPLADLCRREGFPDATFHLRPFRLRDQMIRKILLLRRKGKLKVIRSIIRSFPQRRFVLVGDSGERDPEIYGAVARRFPRQVVSILIRELPQRSISQERGRRAFRNLSPQLWQRFESSDELGRLFPTVDELAQPV